MGFGSFRKTLSKATGGISDITPVGFALKVGEEIEGTFEDPFGTKALEDALRGAGATEEMIAAANIAFQKQIFGEAAPIREAALQAVEQLGAEAAAPLGTSPAFQEAQKRGAVDIRSTLAGFGAADSTTEAQALAELETGLLSQEEQRQQQILQFLAGGAQVGIPGALAAGQLATTAGLARAQTQVGVGQAQAAGKQFGIQTIADLLGTGGTLALLA